MKNTSADQAAAKWNRNLGAAGQAIKDGVNAVTESPMAKAAKSADLMRQNFNAALDSGKWQRGLQRKSLQDWQQAVLTKGVQRIQAGAAAGQANVQQFMAQWLPYIRGKAAQISQMPKGGIANAMARIQANLQAAQDFKRQ